MQKLRCHSGPVSWDNRLISTTGSKANVTGDERPQPHAAIACAPTLVFTHRIMYIFTIPIFQLSTILDPFYPCASMPSHALGDIRSAHPCFLHLLFLLCLFILHSYTPSHRPSLHILLYECLVSPQRPTFLCQNFQLILSFSL